MKILAQRPTHTSAVATILLITETFIVKHYDRRVQKNTASIIIISHVKTDSDCNGNENDNNEKQLGKSTKTIYLKHFV